MARCAKCGKASGIPSGIHLKDERFKGQAKKVHTNVELMGNKPTLQDGRKGKPLNVKNPLK